jgi:hypothetical protein
MMMDLLCRKHNGDFFNIMGMIGIIMGKMVSMYEKNESKSCSTDLSQKIN